MSDAALLRLGILAAGLLLVAAIVLFGHKEPSRSRRKPTRAAGTNPPPRREPVLANPPVANEDLPATSPAPVTEPETSTHSEPVVEATPKFKPNAKTEATPFLIPEFEKIITLYLAARAGQRFSGPDIVVAAEKVSLEFGLRDIFHRMNDSTPPEPIFSMASMMKPGHFDMVQLHTLQTPALVFFLPLPAPMNALDAWETMLPTVQRMADLLGGVILDDTRTVLGRQRIAHIRDEMRAWDRQHPIEPAIHASPLNW